MLNGDGMHRNTFVDPCRCVGLRTGFGIFAAAATKANEARNGYQDHRRQGNCFNGYFFHSVEVFNVEKAHGHNNQWLIMTFNNPNDQLCLMTINDF